LIELKRAARVVVLSKVSALAGSKLEGFPELIWMLALEA